MKNRIFALGMVIATLSLMNCKSTDLEKKEKQRVEKEKKATAAKERKAAKEKKEAEQLKESPEYIIAEEMKVQDVEPIVVYVEKPVYVPESKASSTDYKRLSGVDATKASLERATRKPEHYKDGTFFYTYNENLVYEIYTQPYHLSDIMLEPGELVQGSVLISEDDEVWELTANVAKNPDTGENIQHLFLKPAYSALDSSMVVITDRRVYHFRIKSFKDTYMSMVKFKYPQTKNVWARRASDEVTEDGIAIPSTGSTPLNASGQGDNAPGVSVEDEYITTTDPAFLSFDYKIKYGLKKPEFLPTRVYDDGRKTYIVVDDIVLQKKLPVLFNERNEIVNYSVHKNTFIVPRLINKITLRLGRKKVIVQKKKSPFAKDEPVKEQGEKKD